MNASKRLYLFIYKSCGSLVWISYINVILNVVTCLNSVSINQIFRAVSILEQFLFPQPNYSVQFLLAHQLVSAMLQVSFQYLGSTSYTQL